LNAELASARQCLQRHKEVKHYEAAIQADPPGKSRSIVSTCRLSGQRRAELQEIILDGNKSLPLISGSNPLRIAAMNTAQVPFLRSLGKAINK
jgi:hypothetical protein